MGFQVADPQRKRPFDRSDHVWLKRTDGAWVCCLCGAWIARGDGMPPQQGDKEWRPRRYVPLTEDEKNRCPFDPSKRPFPTDDDR